MKKQKGTGALAGSVEQYGVVKGIEQANTSISIRQLLRGGVNDAGKVAKKLFAGKPISIVWAFLREERKDSGAELDRDEEPKADDPRKFKFAEVQMFGSSVMTLFDSGVITDVISVSLRSRIHLV